jgi:hypothetical protein
MGRRQSSCAHSSARPWWTMSFCHPPAGPQQAQIEHLLFHLRNCELLWSEGDAVEVELVGRPRRSRETDQC